MSTADKLQRLRQTKKDIKAAIEYKIGEIGDIPFSEYAYRLAPEIIQHPKMVGRYSTKGKTNSDTDRNWLRDKSGNGHDVELKNFAWSGMSGYGGFAQNYNSPWAFSRNIVTGIVTDSTINISHIFEGNKVFERTFVENVSIPSYKIRVNGIGNNILQYRMQKAGSIEDMKVFDITSDGIVTLPAYNVSYDGTNYVYLSFVFNKFPVGDYNITIEQLPLYPEGLVFDGIDDFGINENFPILEDYTVIVKRKWLAIGTKQQILVSRRKAPDRNDGAFGIERYNAGAFQTISYDGLNILKNFHTEDITYQTKNSYNGNLIYFLNVKDTERLSIATAIGADYSNIVLYDLIIYGKSLTPEEIQEEIKKYNL